MNLFAFTLSEREIVHLSVKVKHNGFLKRMLTVSR